MIRVHRNRIIYKVVNNKQPQAKKLLNSASAYSLLMMGPLTMKLGALI